MANDTPETVPDGFLITSAVAPKKGADGFGLTMAAGTFDAKGKPTLDVASSVFTGQKPDEEMGKLVGTQVGKTIDALAQPKTLDALSEAFKGNIDAVTAYTITAKDGTPGVLMHVDNDGDAKNNLRGVYNLAKKGDFKLEAPLDLSGGPTPYK